MRELREYLFRVKQELTNLRLLASPPSIVVDIATPLAGLPDPAAVADALRGSAYADEVVRVAESIFTQPAIHWRRDPVSGIETELSYFRLIPYLDPARSGDHKAIWEPNRHQHLVLLAQAHLLTGRREFLDLLFAQWEDWVRENPFQRGINWTSALEVAFRALSWIWMYHFVGTSMDAALRRRFLSELYRHGLHIEANLSIYFSPNTHLLGEALALHALGMLFPKFPRASQWAELGATVLRDECVRQIRPDGSYFEQSSYYHIYALDMYLLHAALGGVKNAELITRMAEYLRALMCTSGAIPFLGDDDGGRLFHPYGDRACFGRATLATCGYLLNRPEWILDPGDLAVQATWWIGPLALQMESASRPEQSRHFEDSGLIVLVRGDRKVLFDAGPFGPGRAGHSHSDTLSVVVYSGDQELLIDPGTFSYSDPEWRNRFRGSAAHNTIRIDGRDQATPLGPFAWSGPPKVRIENCDLDNRVVSAVCEYGGFSHRRRIAWANPDSLEIIDEIYGSSGEHWIEQFWHLGEALDPARLTHSVNPQSERGWCSTAFGTKEEARVIVVRLKRGFPVTLTTLLQF